MVIHSKSHVQSHVCTAALICCMDFRFWKATTNYVQNTLGIYDFDLVTQAGGCQCVAENEVDMIQKVEKHLSISKGLHKIKMLVIVNHQDCGAYGGAKAFADEKSEQAEHMRHLKKSLLSLQASHTGLKVIALFAHFNQFGGISFARVDLPDEKWRTIKKT